MKENGLITILHFNNKTDTQTEINNQKTSNLDHQQDLKGTTALNFSPWEFPIKVFLDIRRALFLLLQPGGLADISHHRHHQRWTVV